MGATFAYFTASVTGNENASSVIVKAANLGTITFKDGSEITLENALPGASQSKTFNITSTTKSTSGVKYGVQLIDITSDFQPLSDLVYTLTGVKSGAESTEGTLISGTDGDGAHSELAILNTGTMDLGTGTIMPGETHQYTFTIKFKETGSDQNSNQGKNFEGTLEIVTSDENSSETYYNNENPSGTTDKPSSSE